MQSLFVTSSSEGNNATTGPCPHFGSLVIFSAGQSICSWRRAPGVNSPPAQLPAACAAQCPRSCTIVRALGSTWLPQDEEDEGNCAEVEGLRSRQPGKLLIPKSHAYQSQPCERPSGSCTRTMRVSSRMALACACASSVLLMSSALDKCL